MAAEAQAESLVPAPAPPTPPARESPSASASPEKRALGEAEEGRVLPQPKRRRASVAALDSVPSAAVEGDDVARPRSVSYCDADGARFSFQHARAGFVAPETTPKFGSFNPPGPAEQEAPDLEPAAPGAGAEVSAEAGGDLHLAPTSQVVGVQVDGQGQTTTHGSDCTLDQPQKLPASTTAVLQ